MQKNEQTKRSNTLTLKDAKKQNERNRRYQINLKMIPKQDRDDLLSFSTSYIYIYILLQNVLNREQKKWKKEDKIKNSTPRYDTTSTLKATKHT